MIKDEDFACKPLARITDAIRWSGKASQPNDVFVFTIAIEISSGAGRSAIGGHIPFSKQAGEAIRRAAIGRQIVRHALDQACPVRRLRGCYDRWRGKRRRRLKRGGGARWVLSVW